MNPCPPRPRRARALLLSIAACGCAGGAGAAVYTRPAPAERLPVVRFLEPLYVPRIEPGRLDPGELRIDEILASPMLTDPDFEAAVAEWVEYWSVSASPWFSDYLHGLASFAATVDSALSANDLPASLLYLPLIESGYNPRASSHAEAVGLWQFMRVTALGLGMEVTPLFDERRDPLKSTEAAIRFLSKLREDFGSWFLALAAYNSGPNRVRRILARHAPDAPGSDSLFWALRHHFPKETRNFVPKLLGSVVVAGAPAEHGYEMPVVEPFRFDQASVPDATTLDVVARAAGVSASEIERLNPEYPRGMTPPGRRSAVRVPLGRGADFHLNYAKIPADERVTFAEHRVSEGETLSDIAYRYGTRVAEIRAANPGVRARYLRIGSVLTVPVAPSVRRGAGP